MANRAGYRKGSGPESEWWILPEVWRAEVCRGHDPQVVARVLVNAGMMRTQQAGKLQTTVRVGGNTLRAYAVTATILAGSSGDEG